MGEVPGQPSGDKFLCESAVLLSDGGLFSEYAVFRARPKKDIDGLLVGTGDRDGLEDLSDVGCIVLGCFTLVSESFEDGSSLASLDLLDEDLADLRLVGKVDLAILTKDLRNGIMELSDVDGDPLVLQINVVEVPGGDEIVVLLQSRLRYGRPLLVSYCPGLHDVLHGGLRLELISEGSRSEEESSFSNCGEWIDSRDYWKLGC